MLEGDTVLTLNGEYAAQYAELMEMVVAGTITSRVAKDLLKEVVFDGHSPKQLAEERGLLQSNSSEELLPIVEQIISEHAAVVAEYKQGKEQAMQFLIGQGMKQTRGSANPATLTELFKQTIG